VLNMNRSDHPTFSRQTTIPVHSGTITTTCGEANGWAGVKCAAVGFAPECARFAVTCRTHTGRWTL
jgi:hypothetical protein